MTVVKFAGSIVDGVATGALDGDGGVVAVVAAGGVLGAGGLVRAVVAARSLAPPLHPAASAVTRSAAEIVAAARHFVVRRRVVVAIEVASVGRSGDAASDGGAELPLNQAVGLPGRREREPGA